MQSVRRHCMNEIDALELELDSAFFGYSLIQFAYIINTLLTMAMDYDTKEKSAIVELKTRFQNQMEPKMYEDENLFYRFLKARNFNIDMAEIMLKNHLQWRKEQDVPNILKYKHPEVLDKYFPYNFVGYDKEGCVVRYIPSGNIDWTGISLCVKTEDLLKRTIYDVEDDINLLKNQSIKLGENVNRCVLIPNLENFSFAAATDKKVILNVIHIFEMYQNNYPEMLKAVYVINASVYFSIAFSAVKKCLTASIVNKIKIYSDDSYKKDLLEIIDADVLPAFLGGNKTDPDGNARCTTFLNHAGPVPDKYYTHKSKRPLSGAQGVQKVTLSNASFQEVTLKVEEPGSFLEWEFQTKSRDIGFGLFYKQIVDNKEKNIELFPLQRINTDEYAETGLYMCEKPGTYVIVFDNTYSWVRSKEIFYRITISPPTEKETEI